MERHTHSEHTKDVANNTTTTTTTPTAISATPATTTSNHSNNNSNNIATTSATVAAHDASRSTNCDVASPTYNAKVSSEHGRGIVGGVMRECELC